ncbi:MAG TPA: Calx-beta domain-containing protein, partial [Pirellulaceae bacterium]
TVAVSLTSGTIVPGRGQADVVIADDDALINEVLANVTNAVNETNREYIELIGAPNQSLNGYYFVVFESEEEGDASNTLNGSSAGIADLVFDLSGLSFGSNGLLVLAPTTWDYAGLASPGTNIVHRTELDGSGGTLEDLSQSYALIRSPSHPIVQGTDYDTVGTYENTSAVAIGTGVGVLDQLPAGADIVDSVGVVEGGGNDRDRVATPQFIGNPGVHIHQPSPFTPGGNVASDALSRRVGQKLPNSIGAWFNGDISNGDPSTGLQYLNDSFFINVVSPDGSELTPGAPNLLRTVYFRVSDQAKEIAEADGSVTLRIERTGDLNEVIDVSYETVDFGSATENEDYTPVTETIQLGMG